MSLGDKGAALPVTEATGDFTSQPFCARLFRDRQ